MLRDVADWIEGLFGLDPATFGYSWITNLVVIGIVALLAFVFIAIFAGPVTWWERRIAARMMSRVGPNRVGPHGVLQWLADGIKNFLKEDLVPASADSGLFKFAPYLVFGGFMLSLIHI